MKYSEQSRLLLYSLRDAGGKQYFFPRRTNFGLKYQYFQNKESAFFDIEYIHTHIHIPERISYS